ncbi:TIGR03745 family integrating conjugative element membrane protein [Carnimonas bestiolae]|uniref:TIGR03745 family integrating conjugative element membrane protein n=1 Tax=Carnimonas bestiolae TaxID=3402172 RepID=UPI003EDC9405
MKKVKQLAQGLRRKWKEIGLLSAMTLMEARQAFADGLPTMEAPEQTGDGGIMGYSQGYMYQGGVLVGLAVSTTAFIVVAYAAIKKFHLATERGEWGNFGLTAVVGAVMLVLTIWLLTKAAPILSQ